MSEHYLSSYSRLLDAFVGNVRDLQTKRPTEVIDRVNAGYDALAAQGLSERQLVALLTIAIDRLAMQGVTA